MADGKKWYDWWKDSMGMSGVIVEEWNYLDDTDKHAWNDVAERIEEEIQVAAERVV